MRGNLADLAATGLASEPTLRKWIAAEPDQPWILKRGSNGDAYEIDLAGAAKAFRTREAAKAEEARRRADDLRQFGLELGLSGGEESTAEISIAERKQLLEEELVAIKLARLRGELVPYAEVQSAIGDVLVKVGQRMRTFSGRLAKKIDLTREQIAAIDRLMEADRGELADQMEKAEKRIGERGSDPGGTDGAEGAAPAVEDTAV